MTKKPVFLLDCNILIALTTPDHTAHEKAKVWFNSGESGKGRHFATCPITQGALLRFHMRLAVNPSIASAKKLLNHICASPLHRFWPDDESYLNLPERGLRGHRQVTDAYLVSLAVAKGGILATLDEPLATFYPTQTVLI